MPRYEPPATCPGSPQVEPLARGSRLFRIHSRTFGPTDFNPTAAASPFRGGRFDSVDGSFACFYAGQDADVAVAETLLRDLTADGGPRLLPFSALRGRMLSTIAVRADTELTSLHGAGLQQIGQDSWLTKCDAHEYPQTRHWALAIRSWPPRTAGFVWRSKRDDDRFAYVLFEDRTPRGALAPLATVPLDAGVGLVAVRRSLARYGVVLKRRCR